MNDIIKITESPRDAQQGLSYTIPPHNRAAYINELLTLGFDVIDFGSFVSPKAVPQMSDTEKVLELVNKNNSNTKLLAIVGNERGAQDAANHSKVDILGFPYSISNTFLNKNIHSDLSKVLQTSKELGAICRDTGKDFRVFISMAFGNPYGDEWSENILEDAVKTLVNEGVQTITLSDTTGLATPESITNIFNRLLPALPNIDFGLHLHTQPGDWEEKIDAAWKAGCRSFDGVINGFGGCPLTGYELLGNVNTLHLLQYIKEHNILHHIDEKGVYEVAKNYPDFKLFL